MKQESRNALAIDDPKVGLKFDLQPSCDEKSQFCMVILSAWLAWGVHIQNQQTLLVTCTHCPEQCTQASVLSAVTLGSSIVAVICLVGVLE